jgi:hypothetical protein
VRLRLLTGTLAALALLCGGPIAAGATFSRGFADDVWFDAPADGISVHRWLKNTESTGARFVQVEVDWVGVEPSAPRPGESPTNPSAKQFNFGYLDAEVAEFERTGLRPVFLVTDAPRWAQGPGGTAAEYATGGYEPNATAFGDLGRALAERYSGHFRDPQDPRRRLPRVRYMQAWAEANTPFHLSPQWSASHGRLINTGALIYRRMLNAFYAGVKTAAPSDKVITSGLEGYGDAPGQGLQRTHPVTFLQNVLCLQQPGSSCGEPAHFDVLASDPYDIGSPTTHAVSPLDASAPDLARLTRLVKAALAAHTLLPDTPKPLWVTEFGYDSNPPNPTKGTISLATQARWLEESFYVFWSEGATTELWYLIRDQTPPYTQNYFSGVYFRDGQPKPSYTAFRFPFVVMHRAPGAQIWGISPRTGTLTVQAQTASGWRPVTTIAARAGSVYTRRFPLPPGRYRATIDAQDSLAWDYGPPRHRTGGQGPSGGQGPIITVQ